MAEWLVLLMYPCVVYLVTQPRAFRLVHKRKPGRVMTPLELVATREALEKDEDIEKVGRWLLLGKLLLAAALLVVWMKWYGFAPSQFAVISNHLETCIATGLVAGAFLICARIAFHRIALYIPGASNVPTIYPQARGPVSVWLLTLVIGTIFEEPWRGSCLLAFQKTGRGPAFAVAATSIAFMFAWQSGFPPRIPRTNFEEVWELLVGAFLAMLFIRFQTIFIPLLASLGYNLVNFAIVRKAVRSRSGAV